MAILGGSPPVCANRKHCIQWISTYMKYCLCSLKDGVSLTIGLVSVVSWTVAEVPQIITNYKQKSTEGLSVAFLITWLFGDLFNLAGCLLEPATLPTQVYMAILYLITTSILALQSIYYNIYLHWKANRNEDHKLQQPVTRSIENSTTNGSKTFQGAVLPSSPIPVAAPVLPRYRFYGRETYYMSARSLSKGHTPPTGLYLAQSQCPCSHDRRIPLSINNPHFVEEPLLGRSAPPPNIKNTLCVVSVITYFLGSFGIHFSVDRRLNVEQPSQGVVIQVGRKLLQNGSILFLRNGAGGSSAIGTFLGWAMSAIYMGGRLPQICLNIRRGNVEGLNPLMFFFALVGNLTYVASILVNSTDPSKIKPNLPWLVDAGGCALLDTFILIQFIYFNNWKSREQRRA